jgi:hypothetical protein
MIVERIKTIKHNEKMAKMRKANSKLKPIKEPEYDEIPTRYKQVEHLFEPSKRKGK